MPRGSSRRWANTELWDDSECGRHTSAARREGRTGTVTPELPPTKPRLLAGPAAPGALKQTRTGQGPAAARTASGGSRARGCPRPLFIQGFCQTALSGRPCPRARFGSTGPPLPGSGGGSPGFLPAAPPGPAPRPPLPAGPERCPRGSGGPGQGGSGGWRLRGPLPAVT